MSLAGRRGGKKRALTGTTPGALPTLSQIANLPGMLERDPPVSGAS